MEELKKSYEEKLAQKEELKRKAAHMELMMDRARRLVEGLAGERIRWKQTVEVTAMTCLLSAVALLSFIS